MYDYILSGGQMNVPSPVDSILQAIWTLSPNLQHLTQNYKLLLSSVISCGKWKGKGGKYTRLSVQAITRHLYSDHSGSTISCLNKALLIEIRIFLFSEVDYFFNLPEWRPIRNRMWSLGKWRILKPATPSRNRRARPDISAAWRLPFLIGTPLAITYASPIVSTYMFEFLNKIFVFWPTVYVYIVGSLPPGSRDPISNARRHGRDRLPESAQCDSNTIRCAVALCFRFLFPFLYMPESSRPILQCHICFVNFCFSVVAEFFKSISRMFPI